MAGKARIGSFTQTGNVYGMAIGIVVPTDNIVKPTQAQAEADQAAFQTDKIYTDLRNLQYAAPSPTQSYFDMLKLLGR